MNQAHNLKNRHLQFMAIGGAIGAGFFLGSGVAISKAGPALLLVYVLAGAVMFLIMRALGELTLAHPSIGSFGAYATMFIGPLPGFITGWSYWLISLLVSTVEATGIGLLLHHWYPGLPQWIPALCVVTLLYAINLCGVKSFGELEYWLSMIKVATIVAVLLYGVAVLIFKIGDLGRQAGISNLWTHGGFMPNGLSGLLAAVPIVIFAFGGIEVIGLAASETERPEQALPRAINSVLYRILFFYIGSLAILMMLLPWNQSSPQESPFVLVLSRAGLSIAASAITFVAISALLSSCNTLLFASSRILLGMASAGQAPVRLSTVNGRNVPYLSVTLSAGALIVGVLLNYFIPDTIFSYALSMVAWLTLWFWASIVLSHLFYRRSVPKERSGIGPFQLPGSPYTNWAVLLVLGLVAVLFALNSGTRVTFYFLLAWMTVLIVAYYANPSRRKVEEGRNFVDKAPDSV
jgi:AAT family amino acid transporter